VMIAPKKHFNVAMEPKANALEHPGCRSLSVLVAHCDMRYVLVICIHTALVEEPTQMIIVEQRASTGASMRKHASGSSALMEASSTLGYSGGSSSAAEYSFESMSAASMSAMTAESMLSMSSSSHMMEMSAHSHAESSSSSSSSMRALTAGGKRGETHQSV